MTKPIIALTMGDPSGIGPELAVRAASSPELTALTDFKIYGCPDIINEAVKRYAPDFTPEIIETGTLGFDEVDIAQASPICGKAAYDALTQATLDTISGKTAAIVTTPMNKASVNLAGIPFTGHTERIADICEEQFGKKFEIAMMQSSTNLRVVFVTTHISIKEIADNINRERILKVTNLLYEAAKNEGVESPKLAMAALNPHAGEDGYMGREDEEIVKPVISELIQKGVNIDGPFPPDTLFISSTLNQYDGIVAMYHDQGHIPFKMLAFDKGVNSTLGLPIIRTSVDHGTAFNIAWKGIADSSSLFAAVKLAYIRTQ